MIKMMGIIRNWLKGNDSKEIEIIDNRVRAAFHKVNTDISQVVAWLEHLHHKHELVSQHSTEKHHKTKAELEKVGRWIEYLHSSKNELKQGFESLKNDIQNLKQGVEAENKELKKRLEALEQRLNVHYMPSASLAIELKPEFKASRLSRLKPSERRVLSVLMNSTERLSYSAISRIVQLNYGTVKNAISGLRTKNIPVKDSSTNSKEKVFYVEKEEVISAINAQN